MGFYDRYNPQGVSTGISSLDGHTTPLDVVPMGGRSVFTLSVAGGGASLALVALTGSLYRLHSFVSPDIIPGTTGSGTLMDNTGLAGTNFLSILNEYGPTDRLDGLLVPGPLYFGNFSSVNPVRFTLAYDIVSTPDIS